MNFKKAFELLKKNIKREPWLAVASVLVLTLTFLTLNVFTFSVMATNVTLNYLENRAQVNIYFLTTVSEEEILNAKSKLEQDERIIQVKYVSKEEALERFKEETKDDPAFLESVKSNPLPASLEVKAAEIADLKALSAEFEQIDGADKVLFHEDVINTFRKWSLVLRIASLVLLSVLSIISIVMIFITVGITIHAKGIEIEILKLVGASDKYVKNPLILQGVFYGVAGAFISTILLFISFPIISQGISVVLKGIQTGNDWWVLLFWDPIFGENSSLLLRIAAYLLVLIYELLFGIALGYIASSAAIKKYLKY